LKFEVRSSNFEVAGGMRLADRYADAGRILRGGGMLWTLIVLLVVFWALGLAFKVAAGLIHVLLVIAVVLFLVNLISGRKARV
jgi:uncharacterized membrane protein YtjA (UPF0391 family)